MALKRALYYLEGTLRLRVRGASIERFLNVCARHDIVLRRMERVDCCELHATVSVRDFRRLRRCMGRTGCRVRVLGRRGLPFVLHRLRGRYVLGGGVFGLLALGFVLTQFLWGIRLTVPASVPEATVLQNLQALGVRTGARIAAIDFEAVQAGMLQRMPALSFVSVSTRGNRVYVQVYARSPKPTMIDEDQPTSVVATQTGVLTRLQVYEGAATKKVGDLVQKGDMLVSALILPHSERGQARLVHAAADAEARTWYTVVSRRALSGTEKRYTGKTRTQYALVFGKKRWNFYFGCGIPQADCDKIRKEYTITFADDFEVPLRLVRQQERFYTTVPAPDDESTVRAEMEQSALARLRASIHGTVTAYSTSFRTLEGGAELTLYAECREQIGQEVLDSQKLPAPTEGEQKHDGTDPAD